MLWWLPDIKLVHCYFITASVINCSVNMWYAGYLICDPQSICNLEIEPSLLSFVLKMKVSLLVLPPPGHPRNCFETWACWLQGWCKSQAWPMTLFLHPECWGAGVSAVCSQSRMVSYCCSYTYIAGGRFLLVVYSPFHTSSNYNYTNTKESPDVHCGLSVCLPCGPPKLPNTQSSWLPTHGLVPTFAYHLPVS